jgi:chromate transporter
MAPGWVSDSAFWAGYGPAQALPGPLFTFAVYLGAIAAVPPGGIAGAVIALVAIFLPGLLGLTAILLRKSCGVAGLARSSKRGP